MRFLLDQDVYVATTRFLRERGHDVLTAADIGCSRSPDSELLSIAREQRRIFVTRDRDFGSLIFVERLATGVIYLRVSPTTLHAGHQELEEVLKLYTEEKLIEAFVVLEPGRYRFRRIPNQG